MYPNIDPKIKNSMVYFKVRSFLKAQKSPNILVYFCKKICYQQLLNIAQSGHTVGNQWDEWKRPKVTGDTKITKKIIIIFVIFYSHIIANLLAFDTGFVKLYPIGCTWQRKR